MSKGIWFAAVAAILPPAAANAQSVTLEQLAARVEALEHENAALRSRLERIAPPSAVAEPAAAPIVSAEPPARLRTVERVAARRWDGPYLGIGAGYGKNRYTSYAPIFAPTHNTATYDGATFSGQIGWRLQSGSLVTGLELEAAIPGDQHSKDFSPMRFDPKLHARVKGQIGITSGPILVYGTGGVQISKIRFANNTGSGKIRPAGFVYGVGAAARIAPRLSLEVETVQSDLTLDTHDFLPYFDFEHRGRAMTLRLNYQLRP